MEKNKLKTVIIKITRIIILLLIIVTCIFIKVKNEGINYKSIMELTNTYPHNKDSFTQGLFVANDMLYETRGLYGESKLYKNINLTNGIPEKIYSFDNSIFAEGSTVLNNKIYVLTYKENKVYRFDLESLQLEQEYKYFKEGWGLTTDGKHLIASDGSSKIYYLDESLNCVKELTVTINNKEINNINELEYIKGYIWANVWYKDYIVVIDPEDGKVIKKITFKELKKDVNVDAGVLNGIAYDKNNDKIYITGKNWNKLFEFKLIQNK